MVKSTTPKWTRPPLADAPFYAMIDNRAEFELLIRYARVITDPKTGKVKRGSGRPPTSDEEAAIARAQNQRLRKFDPSAAEHKLLFDRREFPMEPTLAEEVRRLFGAKPKKFAHRDYIVGMREPGRLNSSSRVYEFVSGEWKTAVESLEPDVHEFFPTTLEFVRPEGKATHSGFVMRDRVFIMDHMPTEFSFSYEREKGAVLDDQLKPVTLTFSKQAVSGRHWFRARSRDPEFARGPFVSRELAERLLPLMPDHVYFVPVAVA
ncbi:MAG: imm11 family protein [Hyphomicrobiaceae bacterium]